MTGSGEIAGRDTQSLRVDYKDHRWNVDFSSALENRTGKYFIGCDLIADQIDTINRVYYWRHQAMTPPTGIARKLLACGLKVETHATAACGSPLLPPRRSNRPTLHLDPLSVAFTTLAPTDIVLCHDLGPISHPDLFQPWVSALYRRLYKRIEQAGSRVVFVSAASRDEYRRLFSDTQPMKVIYPSLRRAIRSARACPIAGIKSRFLLTVGSLGHRKNQATMIRAFSMSGLAAKGVQYVLCGAREPGSEEVERLARTTPGIKLLSYVSDAELAWLYGNATGFALVSRLEGFGLPVAEAISRGLIPIVTRNSVLEEVAGKGALAAFSCDARDIAANMNALCVMEERERVNRLGCLGKSIQRFNAAAFSTAWRQTLAGD